VSGHRDIKSETEENADLAAFDEQQMLIRLEMREKYV
jgi:hypothetical protein